MPLGVVAHFQNSRFLESTFSQGNSTLVFAWKSDVTEQLLLLLLLFLLLLLLLLLALGDFPYFLVSSAMHLLLL